MNDSYTRLPEGYTPLPPGKIANVVTDLEMFAAPPLRAERNAGTLTLVRWERPPLGEYRTLLNYLWNTEFKPIAGIGDRPRWTATFTIGVLITMIGLIVFVSLMIRTAFR